MNTIPTGPTAAGESRPRRRWRNRTAAMATGAVLLGAAVFGATAASAADPGPSPSAGASSTVASSSSAPATTGATSSSSSSPSSAAATDKEHAKHPFVRALRRELRIGIQGKSGFGDQAQAVAYRLIHHTAAFGKLPANLQSDLLTLEAAAAPDRDGAATKIKDTALNGGYGDKIQKEAKAIQTRLAQAPASAKP
ncbi:MAG: hypothetical protein M3017_09110 [Actinomycetota bacterium]|nr:hypothetical protein [Actinomycetota bacterium]